MTHGLGGTRHFLLPNFGSVFHDAGYVVLLYGNRNSGYSDGLPRQEINPPLQQADYYDAFNFAASQITRISRSYSDLLEDGRQITSGLDPPTVPLIAADRESSDPATTNAMFPTKDAHDILTLQKTCGSRWENYITSQTQLHMLGFEGQCMIHSLTNTTFVCRSRQRCSGANCIPNGCLQQDERA